MPAQNWHLALPLVHGHQVQTGLRGRGHDQPPAAPKVFVVLGDVDQEGVHHEGFISITHGVSDLFTPFETFYF